MTPNSYSEPIEEAPVVSIPSVKRADSNIVNVNLRWRIAISIMFVLIGFPVLLGGAYFMLFKNPRSGDEDLAGLAAWSLGSAFLGFGMAFLRFNWILSTAIAMLSPGLTFGMAVCLFWLPAIIAAFLGIF